MGELTTKEKIFNVAIDLFSRSGYNEVSIREIAKEVGIKESSIYYHYSKKEDILNKIFEYFINRMNNSGISDEEMEELLSQSPKILYHFGSEAVKKQFNQLKMIKILRLIFLELHHNEKIREFFLEEMINKPIMFWTFFFQKMMDKKIIKSSDPKELAENYYKYAMFKIFEAIILEYPEDPQKINLDEIFNNIENHFNLILTAVAVDKESINPLNTVAINENLLNSLNLVSINKRTIKYSNSKRKINKTVLNTIDENKKDKGELDNGNNKL